MKKIHIIGVGLMGGSFAKSLKLVFPEVAIFGIDSKASHIEKARSLGIIDNEGIYKEFKTTDLVVLATPVDVAIQLLPKALDHIGDSTLVIDLGSTKAGICEKVSNHKNRRNYLASHPIAGTEFSGPTAAISNLFQGKTMIISEIEKTAFVLQERALDIYKKLGMRIRYMDPVSHDKHIAYVSHLSHISSFMLGKTVIEEEKNEHDIFDMAGSGFESTVRLAKSSPTTWTPIFKQNKENVLNTLSEYISNLQNFKALMENDDFETVFLEMKQTNRIKEILKGI